MASEPAQPGPFRTVAADRLVTGPHRGPRAANSHCSYVRGPRSELQCRCLGSVLSVEGNHAEEAKGFLARVAQLVLLVRGNE